MKQIIVQSLVSSTQTAVIKGNKLVELLIEDNIDIKLLSKEKYSNKRGFIGGCISKLGDAIIVFGDLDKIDINGKIRAFILSKKVNIIEFKGLDVIDYGGLIEI